jgi:hypothetical protein
VATTVIGVDCATQPKKTGLARGLFEAGAVSIDQVLVGSMVKSVARTIAGWASGSASTLLAIDAPLGWPPDLDQALSSHEAGEPVWPEANLLFRRETDRTVKRLTGKQPLDVGADRIARTAHTALSLLQALRDLSGESISLAWDPSIQPGIHAIEVYPGATLAAYGMKAAGYKKKDRHDARRALLAFLGEHLVLPHGVSLMEENDDALDAALCVLAGLDFLRGEAVAPEDLPLTRKEGWIWVRRPL